MKPPPSTTGRYLPGVGMTLTRANIAYALKAGLIDAKDDAATVALKFQPHYRGNHTAPEHRHVGRAYRLLAPKTAAA